MEAYMDNAATTPVLPEVRDIMIKVMEEHILENTKIEPKEWAKIKTKENYYWPEQQVEKGIVDKICSSIDEVL